MRANVEPWYWGRCGWLFLSACVKAVDDESRSTYDTFLKLVPEVIPCATCRMHGQKFVKEHPPEKAKDLSQWLMQFENDVATRKSKRPPSMLRVIFFYLLLCVFVILI